MRTCGAPALRSLSSGVPVAPWQTLLERPRPGATAQARPSFRARASSRPATVCSLYNIVVSCSAGRK
eukprot:4961478-Pleurochrysis_carterae.AAC.1